MLKRKRKRKGKGKGKGKGNKVELKLIERKHLKKESIFESYFPITVIIPV